MTTWMQLTSEKTTVAGVSLSGGSKGWATGPWPSPIIIRRFLMYAFNEFSGIFNYLWIRLLIYAIKQSHSTVDAALFCANIGNLLAIPPVKEL